MQQMQERAFLPLSGASTTPTSSYFAPLSTSVASNLHTEINDVQHEQTAERISSLHARLQQEAEKIRKWKIHTELDIRHKDNKIQEATQTIESLRKGVLELQIQNENLSLKLQEEIDNRSEIVQRNSATREMCIILKDYASKVEDRLQKCETERTELSFAEKEHADQFDDTLNKEKILILDPSLQYRPEKDEESFRDFSPNSVCLKRVYNVYKQMHTFQTRDFALEKLQSWTRFDHGKMTIMEALECLNSFVDECDPDTDSPNSVHAFQTAERIRQAHPDKDWFHLVGLMHDLGKVMACFGEPQWCVVGDTFPLGCAFSKECVFGADSFADNPDVKDSQLNSKLGIYEENCGLEHVVMSWGHDEYLYRVMRNHAACTLPEEAYFIVRFHSFYPWHTSGEYDFLCNNKDREMLGLVKEFNKFDLYSKADSIPDMNEVSAYYQELVDKYLPGKISW